MSRWANKQVLRPGPGGGLGGVLRVIGVHEEPHVGPSAIPDERAKPRRKPQVAYVFHLTALCGSGRRVPSLSSLALQGSASGTQGGALALRCLGTPNWDQGGLVP